MFAVRKISDLLVHHRFQLYLLILSHQVLPIQKREKEIVSAPYLLLLAGISAHVGSMFCSDIQVELRHALD